MVCERGGGSVAELETVNLSLVFSVVDPSLLSFQCVRTELIVAFVVREPAEDPPPPSFFSPDAAALGAWPFAPLSQRCVCEEKETARSS